MPYARKGLKAFQKNKHQTYAQYSQLLIFYFETCLCCSVAVGTCFAEIAKVLCSMARYRGFTYSGVPYHTWHHFVLWCMYEISENYPKIALLILPIKEASASIFSFGYISECAWAELCQYITWPLSPKYFAEFHIQRILLFSNTLATIPLFPSKRIKGHYFFFGRSLQTGQTNKQKCVMTNLKNRCHYMYDERVEYEFYFYPSHMIKQFCPNCEYTV